MVPLFFVATTWPIARARRLVLAFGAFGSLRNSRQSEASSPGLGCCGQQRWTDPFSLEYVTRLGQRM